MGKINRNQNHSLPRARKRTLELIDVLGALAEKVHSADARRVCLYAKSHLETTVATCMEKKRVSKTALELQVEAKAAELARDVNAQCDLFEGLPQ